MKSCFRRIEIDRLPELYHMMQQQHFPGTPQTFAEAKKILTQADIYGDFDENSHIVFCFIVFNIKEKSCFFDVICKYDSMRKWASKKRVKAVLVKLFLAYGFERIYSETCLPHVRKMLDQIGAHQLSEYRFVLTPNSLKPQYQKLMKGS